MFLFILFNFRYIITDYHFFKSHTIDFLEYHFGRNHCNLSIYLFSIMYLELILEKERSPVTCVKKYRFKIHQNKMKFSLTKMFFYVFCCRLF